ncbi:T-lymphocyte activation antigen CD86 [Xenopus tropicalis]|uniref:T-lymphocyte activation antigen CD86 n=2 Tax=Xenopus tropicalis TaxID=8364 RepID=A0A803K1Y5_XENTR|nr:T-lymphocyte activation antigen CD86 [Xenopus tropicalis]|eukprot:XP_017946874.1 PREDICTED: T-lymphocyte activation antigen CD86-like [Xenopus tropicalis]
MIMTRLVLLYLIPLAAWAKDAPRSMESGEALYGGTAGLKCSPSTNLSLQKPSFYWQNEVETIFNVDDGVPDLQHVKDKYKNRIALKENWDLYLHNVTVEDEGEYSNYIIKKTPWREHAHICVFRLKVRAHFSPTESHSSPTHNTTRGEDKTLECSLAGGYPKPSGLMWRVVNSSGTFTMKENFSISEDVETKLYNISSSLSVMVEGNTTISCLILKGGQTTDTYEFSIIVDPENISSTVPPVVTPPVMKVSLCIASGLVLLILLVTILMMFLKKKRKRPCCTDACKGHIPVRQAEENTEEAPQQDEAMELVEEGRRNGS